MYLVVKTIFKKTSMAAALGAFAFGLCPNPNAFAGGFDDTHEYVVGDLDTISAPGLTRVSITNPDVADITDVKKDGMTVLAKKPGDTVMFIWDRSGKKSVGIRVLSQDLNMARDRIAEFFKQSGINEVTIGENPLEGKLVVSGELTKKKKDDADKILTSFGDLVINLIKEEQSEELVQIDIQVLDLSATYTKNLGVQWNDGEKGTNLIYPEEKPITDGSIGDYFKIGKFNRQTPLQFQINALLKESHGKVISKPRLVVESGKEASFLVGGEVPISTTTASSTGSTVGSSITFKSYGVNLTVTPTIREKNKIDVQLNVNISDVDGKVQGNDTAFLTRTAQTTLFMDDGQTIVLAGLIKHNEGTSVNKVPFLGQIPVVGLLFRNKTLTPNDDTEMVIIFTPTILKSKKYATRQTVMPTKGLRGMASEIDSHYETEPTEKFRTPSTEAMNQKTPQAPLLVPMMMDPVPSYVQQVQQKISQAVSYPAEAMGNQWQGTVKLRLHILSDGTLLEAKVMESSGHDIFDQDAVNTAKTAVPYPAFDSRMNQSDIMITVPIVYSQR